MANVDAYPVADVTVMAELTGYSFDELRRSDFTQELFEALMGNYYAGTLTPIVNPGQGTRAPGEVAVSTFLSGVGSDVASVGVELATATRDAAGAAIAATKGAVGLLRATPLLVLVAGVIAATILLRKA